MKRYFLPAHPALRLLAYAVFGIALAFALPVSPFAWLGVATFLCVVTGLLLFVNRKRLPSGKVSVLCAASYLLMVAAAFAFHASAAFRLAPSPSLLSWIGREVILSGIVDGRPVVSNGKARMRVRVCEVFEDGRTTPVSDWAKVVVRMPGDEETRFQEGDFVRVKGRPALIPGASNRDEYDARFRERLKGTHVQIFCAGPWQVLRESAKQGFSPIRAFVNPARNYLTSAIDLRFPGGAERGFIKGMMLGEREMVEEEVYDAFRLTGTAHVLVVSGFHVALLASAVSLAVQRLRVRPTGRWVSLVIVVAVIALYSFVTGNAPSTRRAAIMASVIFVGREIGQKRYPLNLLATADLLILLIDPLELFNPGFQMTNGAVAGIMTIYPWLSGLVPDGKGAWRHLGHLLWSAFSVSLSAMIGISPVIAFYFGTFSPSGIIANVPVVFFSSLAMYASFPMVLFHGFAGGVAELFGLSSWLFARIALWWVELFGRLPFASVEVHPDLFRVAAMYLMIAFGLHALFNRARGRLAIAVLVGLNLLLWHDALRPVPEPPKMVTVNFGRDVAVLFSSGGETLLVNAARQPMDRERIRRQAELWGLAVPTAVAGLLSSASDEQLQPFGAGFMPESRQFAVRRPAERVLKIDAKARSWLLVSGLKQLETQRADGADVVLWIGRFSERDWRRLDVWIASARPRRMLIVPGSSMPFVQRGLLARFASQHPSVEVRSRSEQTAWY
ncbi:ComEC family competence protein [Chlorobaculum sp. 24CR]|uniref:ComEC/Rec2 family competence protein n=1 Tax=Chlorobaculum sp. 24CR TaxID=2508878 RepID=UPI00100ACE99|nr:ComEC/Rec2 family competence protein [Chlorobaculum sp. 24CR]RXK81643.1 ComEC family competence protein [Chlorobaculum sp. 24CR]